jgi:predicted nucleic acid-binding protein
MIIDTMVMAYALVGYDVFGPQSKAALRKADELVAPASVEAELVSTFWQWGRERIPHTTALACCADAAQLWNVLIPVKELWSEALTLAFESNHSPYDTLFVVAARKRRTKVLTYDKDMLKRFPEDTITVPAFLG